MSLIKGAPSAIKVVTGSGGGNGERIDKTALLNRLWIIRMKEYNEAYEGQYGTSPRAIVDLTEVGGEEQEIKGYWAWSVAAKQLGENLALGEIGLARFVSLTAKNGREYMGWQWSSDPSDYAKADERLASAEKKPF